MNNFTYYSPTRIVFGKDTENQAGALIKKDGGSRVFIVYGGGSCVRSGLLDRVTASLDQAGLAWEAFGGAKPNPTLAHAREGVKKSIAFGSDYVLAVGGGSAIDTAKAIAHGTANPDADLWDLWFKRVPLTKSIPISCVLTIAAAGSEVSGDAVLTNEEEKKKKGFGTDLNRCHFAILNPALLSTLPKKQLAAGITDIMQHTMERYFIPGVSCMVTDEIAEGLLRTMISAGRRAMADQNDYDALAEIMWCGSLSHSDLTELGRGKDFSVHKLGQALGGVYDYTHGDTLSAVWGAWATYLYKACPERFSRFARKVWGVEEEDDLKTAAEGIRRNVAFYKELGMPVSLKDLGLDPTEEEIHVLSMFASYDKTITITKILPVDYEGIRTMFRMAIDGVVPED